MTNNKDGDFRFIAIVEFDTTKLLRFNKLHDIINVNRKSLIEVVEGVLDQYSPSVQLLCTRMSAHEVSENSVTFNKLLNRFNRYRSNWVYIDEIRDESPNILHFPPYSIRNENGNEITGWHYKSDEDALEEAYMYLRNNRALKEVYLANGHSNTCKIIYRSDLPSTGTKYYQPYVNLGVEVDFGTTHTDEKSATDELKHMINSYTYAIDSSDYGINLIFIPSD